jgi:hypothetical protein
VKIHTTNLKISILLFVEKIDYFCGSIFLMQWRGQDKITDS